MIQDYIALIDLLLDDRIEAATFERRYLSMFKDEKRPMSDATFRILDRLFACVDAYCGDPELRDEDDLDDEGLRAAACRAREQLGRSLAGSGAKNPVPTASSRYIPSSDSG